MVVHSRTQSEVTELFPKEIDRILFVPDLGIQKLLFYLSRYLPRRLSEATLGLFNQLITQFCERAVVRGLIRDQDIDVIHQPIPVAPRFPSVLFGLGVPVVIGPLNGGMEYPPAFRRSESWMSRMALGFARSLASAGNTLLPGKKYASVVLVANERTRRALPLGIRGKVIELVENGIDVGVWQSAQAATVSAAPRFVFVGRLVDWKAVDVAIRALQFVSSAELDIVGDGPMMDSWHSLAAELGLKDRIHFKGWLTQSECASLLVNSVALVLPSVYECGGAVVLEAMAMGKPVIATRWGGPADYLDASCGILVEPDSYASLVAGFGEAMARLVDTPGLARLMGAAGRERVVRDFDWQQKVDRMIGIYGSVAKNRDVFHKLESTTISNATTSEGN
jgi:glycosyltransferase involved in cell wall biosynthesis